MDDEIILNALRAPTEVADDFPTSMPLLDDFRLARRGKSNSLANTDLLLIQHNLGPILLRLEALFDEDLEPDRTWLVDVPYSTNERVRKEIPKRFGIPRLQISPPLRDPIAPYAGVQLRRVEDIVYHLANRLSQCQSKLLVVDDGAYFVRALRNIEEFEPSFTNVFKKRTAIVEQTKRGHNYLDEQESIHFLEATLEAPVVSIACCNTKAKFEAPFIGEAAVRGLLRALKREEVDMNDLGRKAIIGFGKVGRAVFRSLNQYGHISPICVVEKNKEKHQEIKDLGGVPHTFLPNEYKYDLVIGCTGEASFELKDWERLSNNAVLASTSSAAVEFNRRKFLDLAELYPDDEIEIVNKEEAKKEGIRATLKIRKGDKQVTFIHASFPVNFDGRMECIPIQVIQATHTLLYAAGYQALETKQPGLHMIDSAIDSEIKIRALEHLKREMK